MILVSSGMARRVYDTLRTWLSTYGAPEDFLPTRRHLLICKNTTRSLRIGEYENVFPRLTTHKTMVCQNWPSKRLSVYLQTIRTDAVGCAMIVQSVT